MRLQSCKQLCHSLGPIWRKLKGYDLVYCWAGKDVKNIACAFSEQVFMIRMVLVVISVQLTRYIIAQRVI